MMKIIFYYAPACGNPAQEYDLDDFKLNYEGWDS